MQSWIVTRLSHRALPRTTAILASATAILAVQVEAVQGKQDPLEWTETSGYGRSAVSYSKHSEEARRNN